MDYILKMKKFLKKIKLIDDFIIELDIDKNEFVLNLKEHVDESDIGIFSDTFDVFSSSKNEFKGHVGFQEFKIQRRGKFFDKSANLAIATGTFTQIDEVLIIKTDINGFRKRFIPFYIFGIAIYTFILVMVLQTGSGAVFSVFPFIFIHASFMFGVPYFIMRRSVKRMKHDLEREFYYMTKNQL